MAADKNITIKFLADGDKELIGAFKDLAKSQRKFNTTSDKTKKSLDKTKQALDKTNKSLGVFEARNKRNAKSMGFFGNSLSTVRSKLLIFNFAVAMGAKQLFNMAKSAATMQSMEKSFETLSGGVSKSSAAMGKLRRATNDTMSDFDLLQQANNAMILGVSKNSTEMAKMFDVAQRLGRALGRDTKSSVESLITGIGRQSRLMLDNIGIIVKSEEAYKAYAEKLDTTADKLTDGEKKTAFMEAAMDAANKKVRMLGKEQEELLERWFSLSYTCIRQVC